jgi:hypothetical protein
LGIGSLEFDLVKSMFYARPGVRILSVPIAKFHPSFFKFETFEMQVFDDITSLQFHRNGAFWLFTSCDTGLPAAFSRRNSKLSQHTSISPGY